MGASWLESSRYSAKSTTVASGTFFCTEAMPFVALALDS
jgi:hypothetical protein